MNAFMKYLMIKASSRMDNYLSTNHYIYLHFLNDPHAQCNLGKL